MFVTFTRFGQKDDVLDVLDGPGNGPGGRLLRGRLTKMKNIMVAAAADRYFRAQHDAEESSKSLQVTNTG